MKKLILSLLILNLFSSTVYGETNTIPLTYNVEPNYVIYLPSSVDITNNQTNFNFYVSGDIYYDYYLEILFDTQVLINNADTYQSVSISQDKSLFDYSDLSNGATGLINISHDDLSSGKWTGTLNLMITLKEG